MVKNARERIDKKFFYQINLTFSLSLKISLPFEVSSCQSVHLEPTVMMEDPMTQNERAALRRKAEQEQKDKDGVKHPTQHYATSQVPGSRQLAQHKRR